MRTVPCDPWLDLQLGLIVVGFIVAFYCFWRASRRR